MTFQEIGFFLKLRALKIRFLVTWLKCLLIIIIKKPWLTINSLVGIVWTLKTIAVILLEWLLLKIDFINSLPCFVYSDSSLITQIFARVLTLNEKRKHYTTETWIFTTFGIGSAFELFPIFYSPLKFVPVLYFATF